MIYSSKESKCLFIEAVIVIACIYLSITKHNLKEYIALQIRKVGRRKDEKKELEFRMKQLALSKTREGEKIVNTK